MGIAVRKAATEDIEWCLGQLREFSAVYGTKQPLFPEDLDHARTCLSHFMSQHLVLVAERDGHPVGFIAGFVTPHPFNPNIRTVTEQFWWVTPEARGSSAGLRLLDAFIREAEALADWVTISIEHGSPLNSRILEKRGFRPIDTQYLREVG